MLMHWYIVHTDTEVILYTACTENIPLCIPEGTTAWFDEREASILMSQCSRPIKMRRNQYNKTIDCMLTDKTESASCINAALVSV